MNQWENRWRSRGLSYLHQAPRNPKLTWFHHLLQLNMWVIIKMTQWWWKIQTKGWFESGTQRKVWLNYFTEMTSASVLEYTKKCLHHFVIPFSIFLSKVSSSYLIKVTWLPMPCCFVLGLHYAETRTRGSVEEDHGHVSFHNKSH